MNGEQDAPSSDDQNQPGGQWEFKPDDNPPPEPAAPPPQTPAPEHVDQSVRWTASQFVAHHKSVMWYVNLIIVTGVLAGLVYWLTSGDVIATMAVVVAAFFFGVVAARKPRVLEYEVNSRGISAGRQFFPYSSFKSFAVVEEGAVSGLVFMPLKRFMPALTIYCAPEDEGKIIALLSSFLPLQEAKEGPVEHLMHRIRF